MIASGSRGSLLCLMKTVLLTPLAQSLPSTVPFVGPETQEKQRGQAFIARLGANENAFGPSPQAIAAMQKAASQVWMYADPENYDLRAELAAHHQIAPENIIIGEGIDTLLGLTTRLFIEPGTAVVTSAGAYPTFNYHANGFGGVLHQVPYKGDHEDPDALIAKAHEVTAKLVYIANPDNPMGSWHAGTVIADMAAKLPDDCLLILDEAYVEFAPECAVPRIAPDTGNVIRFRTFSKAYGMAGARVGYCIGPAGLINAFNKIRNHFGMGRISQAGALAALADQDWLAQTKEKVIAARARIADIGVENGLMPLPSATNFVTLDCGADGTFARAVLAALVDLGIFVRMPFVAPQDRCIRISCGTAADLDALAIALPKALHNARKNC